MGEGRKPNDACAAYAQAQLPDQILTYAEARETAQAIAGPVQKQKLRTGDAIDRGEAWRIELAVQASSDPVRPYANL